MESLAFQSLLFESKIDGYNVENTRTNHNSYDHTTQPSAHVKDSTNTQSGPCPPHLQHHSYTHTADIHSPYSPYYSVYVDSNREGSDRTRPRSTNRLSYDTAYKEHHQSSTNVNNNNNNIYTSTYKNLRHILHNIKSQLSLVTTQKSPFRLLTYPPIFVSAAVGVAAAVPTSRSILEMMFSDDKVTKNEKIVERVRESNWGSLKPLLQSGRMDTTGTTTTTTTTGTTTGTTTNSKKKKNKKHNNGNNKHSNSNNELSSSSTSTSENDDLMWYLIDMTTGLTRDLEVMAYSV